MHELSILLSMADEIKSLPEIKQGGNLKRITVKIGEVSGVDEEALLFAYPLLKDQDSRFSNAELEIIKVSLTIECGECGSKSNTKKEDVKCDKCGSRNINFTGGDEILISELEFET